MNFVGMIAAHSDALITLATGFLMVLIASFYIGLTIEGLRASRPDRRR